MAGPPPRLPAEDGIDRPPADAVGVEALDRATLETAATEDDGVPDVEPPVPVYP